MLLLVIQAKRNQVSLRLVGVNGLQQVLHRRIDVRAIVENLAQRWPRQKAAFRSDYRTAIIKTSPPAGLLLHRVVALPLG